MNTINNVYTTIDGGRTHIAADKKYIGSVNSYNNCFTKFFAWISGRSMTVNFDGKTRSVNKRSYLKLVRSLVGSEATISNIGKYSMFRGVAEKGKLPETTMMMREAISDKTRQSLFRALAKAISTGNTDKALLMIGKGAALNMEYYDRGYLSPAFHSDIEGLSSERKYKFTVFKGTPILQAARKTNKLVVQKLKEYGASTQQVGKQYLFEREITGVSKNYDFHFEPTVNYGFDGRLHSGFSPHFEEHVIVHTKDHRTNLTNHVLNESLKLV